MKGCAYLLAGCFSSYTLVLADGNTRQDFLRLKYEAQIIAVDKSLMTPRCNTYRDKQRTDVVVFLPSRLGSSEGRTQHLHLLVRDSSCGVRRLDRQPHQE